MKRYEVPPEGGRAGKGSRPGHRLMGKLPLDTAAR